MKEYGLKKKKKPKSSSYYLMRVCPRTGHVRGGLRRGNVGGSEVLPTAVPAFPVLFIEHLKGSNHSVADMVTSVVKGTHR